MNGLLNWFFSTDALGFGEDQVVLDWARPIPGWGWLLIVVGAAGFAWCMYFRLVGRQGLRLGLALLRALLLVLIAALISGPRLIKEPTTTEPDWVVVLADRSGSLAVQDGPEGVSRDQQLRDTLAWLGPALDQAKSGDEAERQKRVLLLGFDRSTYDTTWDTQSLPQPTGNTTRIGDAITQAIDAVGGKPISAVILISDGRSADTPQDGLIARLDAERIPVFPVALGGAAGSRDHSISRVEAPSAVFEGDTVPVRVWVGASGEEADEPTRVELVDALTGEVLAETETSPDEPAVLLAHPDEVGAREWRVRIASDTRDLIPENDTESVRIEIVDRPLRIIYIDGYPRWEQRYLKSLLLREGSIRSSSVLLASDRQYQQEGDEPLSQLPITPQDWAEFDVVVIGDVRAELFGTEQLESLRTHISEHGAGLLWAAGPASTPQTWRTTPLADLIPLRQDAGSGSRATLARWTEDVTMSPTSAADLISLLQLGSDQPGSADNPVIDPESGWSRLRWAQLIPPRAVKPGAEVLAMASPVSGTEQPTPLVLAMRFGAGRVAYVGTDETWRWRYGLGEARSESFWIPLIRSLARNRLERAGKSAVLRVFPEPVVAGEVARIELEVIDQALVEASPDSVFLDITDSGGRPQRVSVVQENSDETTNGAGVRYVAPWAADSPGRYTIQTNEPLFADLGLSTSIRVIDQNSEMRYPQANHALLEQLAEASGGAMLTRADAEGLKGMLPDRSIEVPASPQIETLWDKPWALVLALLLLSLEWVGRRVSRLA